jgi:hypothetical protein
MKYAWLFVVVLLSGCSWFQAPEITDPATGITYKGKHAVQVYAHQQQQEQLKERWAMLTAMANKKTGETATAQATHNMLLQSLVYTTQGTAGGDYFKMLAEKSRNTSRFWTTALAVLGPAFLHYALYGSNGYGGSGDISSEVSAGGDIVLQGGPATISAPSPTIGGVPTTTAPPAGFAPAISLGGIGNNVGSPEALNALYRSQAAQNQGSGFLTLDSEKPANFKDIGGPASFDDRDGGNDTSLF